MWWGWSITVPWVHKPGLGSLVFRAAMAIGVLLCVVRILLRSGRRTGEMSPVVGIRMSPVPVPLSRVRCRVILVPVLLGIPVVVLSFFGSVGLMARVGPGATSVIHDDPLHTRSAYLNTWKGSRSFGSYSSHMQDAVKVHPRLPHHFTGVTTWADNKPAW